MRLQQVEIAWDIPCPHLNREGAEALVLKLAENMLPGFSHARLWRKWGKPQLFRTGMENGSVTAYFKKCHRYRQGQDVWVKKPAWKPKVYAKKIGGIWHVRVEVTLEKRFLQDNGVALDIPSSVSPDWLAEFPLDKFLGFASFCRRGFRGAMAGTKAFKDWCQEQASTRRRYKRPHPCQVLLAAAQDLPACEQRRISYVIAETLDAVRLKKRINDGEFDCPYYPFEE